MTTRLSGASFSEYDQEAEVERHAEQREPGHQHAGDGARLEGELEPARQDVVAAWAVRTLARTETFMPMKPVAPESTAPIREADGGELARERASSTRTTMPTMPMVVYWRRR